MDKINFYAKKDFDYKTLGFEDAYSQWNNSSIVVKSEMDNLLSLLGDAI